MPQCQHCSNSPGCHGTCYDHTLLFSLVTLFDGIFKDSLKQFEGQICTSLSLTISYENIVFVLFNAYIVLAAYTQRCPEIMTCPYEKLWPSVTQPIFQPDEVVLGFYRSINFTIRMYNK